MNKQGVGVALIAAVCGFVGGLLALAVGPLQPTATSVAPAAPLVAGATDAPGSATLAAAIKAVEPGVVTIDTWVDGKTLVPDLLKQWLGDLDLPEMVRGSGSGFIVDAKEGLVVTNQHVVDHGERFTVILNDGRKLPAELAGADRLADVGVLRVKPDKLPEVRLGRDAKLEQGHWVLAVGNPFREFSGTATVGIVSALGRTMKTKGREYKNLIQTDAAINMGNSGGPLCDLQGRVIGINSAIFALSGGNLGIGFAIPIDDAMHIVEGLVSKGGVPWLGLEMLEPEPGQSTTGVTVKHAKAGGPADKAGLRPGDLIVNVGGQSVTKPAELSKRVLEGKVGDSLDLTVERDGSRRSIKVVLEARPN